MRDDGDDLEFLGDLEWVAQGGRWGPLGGAQVFTDETLAVAVAGRLHGARATCFA